MKLLGESYSSPWIGTFKPLEGGLVDPDHTVHVPDDDPDQYDHISGFRMIRGVR